MATPLNLTHCTLTGVDERTDLDEIAQLSTDYPVAEWGFIYSPKRQGQPGRYPSVEFLQRAFRELPAHVRVALHFCGQGVTDLLNGELVAHRLAMMVASRGGRIQLNFNHSREEADLSAVKRFLNTFPALTVITQHNEANTEVWEALREHPNHAVLFDASGGRGIKVDRFPEMLPSTPCGYAGGLGHRNLYESLEQLADVAGSRAFWVDMEGSLRITDDNGNDWLDVMRCEHCLDHAQRHVVRHSVTVADSEGWWVPVDQFYGQKVLPITGAWQKVRGHTGIIIKACLMAGKDGWRDGDYEVVDGVTEWLKPSRWFRGADDLTGDIAAVTAYKAGLSRSPLRNGSPAPGEAALP